MPEPVRTVSTPTIPHLPLDVLGVVAQHLVAADMHGACAALKVASRDVRYETTPTLWRRLLYKWRNGKNDRKKSAVKWRTAFESSAAKYIQFLMVIPTVVPDVNVFESPCDPPFVASILAKPNKLKVVLVAGHGDFVGIALHNNFQPCSPDVCAIMDCTQIIHDKTDEGYLGAMVRPYFTTDAERDVFVDDVPDIGGLFARTKGYLGLYPSSRKPFLKLRFGLPRGNSLCKSAVTQVAVDMLMCQWPAARWYCDDRMNPGEKELPPRILQFGALGMSFRQAQGLAQAASAAYVFDPLFAGVNFRLSINEPITPQQAKAITRIVERNYLKTSPLFRERTAGGMFVIAESKGTSDAARMSTVTGMIQFHPVGQPGRKKFHAVRDIAAGGRSIFRDLLFVKADDESSDAEEDLSKPLGPGVPLEKQLWSQPLFAGRAAGAR